MFIPYWSALLLWMSLLPILSFCEDLQRLDILLRTGPRAVYDEAVH
jgi:hypothetical protein